jgi:hypothetical protein
MQLHLIPRSAATWGNFALPPGTAGDRTYSLGARPTGRHRLAGLRPQHSASRLSDERHAWRRNVVCQCAPRA